MLAARDPQVMTAMVILSVTGRGRWGEGVSSQPASAGAARDTAAGTHGNPLAENEPRSL